jgi:uncharacterized membrane protein
LGCSALHGCGKVAADPHSWGLGIPALHSVPTAAFGLATYLVLAALSFARVWFCEAAVAQRIPRLQLLLSAVGVGVSAWLTYLEVFDIKALCQWCLTSAAVVVLIFLVTGAEWMNARRADPRSDM